MFAEIFINLLYIALFFVIAFVGLKIFDFAFNLTDSKQQNIVRAGLVASIAIATSPLFEGDATNLLIDILQVSLISIFVIILTIFSHMINDTITFPKVRNIDAIRKGNIALAIVEFSSLIAVGIVIGTILDSYDDILKALPYAFIGYLMSQIMINIGVILYEKALDFIYKVNIRDMVYESNISAGILMSSVYIVTAFLIAGAFTPSTSFATQILDTIKYFLVSGVIVVGLKYIIDHVLVPSDNIKNIIKKDLYFKAFFIEMTTISTIFVYHFMM
jgi:uncharacterized membrane protein YjfL (UPF0719 family)